MASLVLKRPPLTGGGRYFVDQSVQDMLINQTLDQSMDTSNMSSEDYEPPKKKRTRARLDHLTPSEKLMRRKQKNRIAAQTARDRKRAKIDQLEAENRKLRQENEQLKHQLLHSSSSTGTQTRQQADLNSFSQTSLLTSMPNIVVKSPIDSGVSDVDAMSKASASHKVPDTNTNNIVTQVTTFNTTTTNAPKQMATTHPNGLLLSPQTACTVGNQATTDMNYLMVPKNPLVAADATNINSKNNNNGASCPHSPASSGVYSVASNQPTTSNESDDYIDSVIGQTDESALIDDILRLQDSVFSDSENVVSSIGSAELINAPPQKVQEKAASFQSLLVENSAGWTSVQLMLLLLISRVHRLLSLRTNCCAMRPEKTIIMDYHNEDGFCGNLYDYIQHTHCTEFRGTTKAIITHKNDIHQQRLIALGFVNKYLKFEHSRRLDIRTTKRGS